MYRPKGVVFGLIWSGKGNRICLRNLEKSTIFADSVNHRHFSYFALRFLSRVVASLRRFSEKKILSLVALLQLCVFRTITATTINFI